MKSSYYEQLEIYFCKGLIQLTGCQKAYDKIKENYLNAQKELPTFYNSLRLNIKELKNYLDGLDFNQKLKYTQLFFYTPCLPYITKERLTPTDSVSIEQLETIMSSLGDVGKVCLKERYAPFYNAINNKRYDLAIKLLDYYHKDSLETPFVSISMLMESPFFPMVASDYTFLEYVALSAKNNEDNSDLYKVAEALLKRGANPNGKTATARKYIENNFKYSGNPLYVSKEQKFCELSNLLEKKYKAIQISPSHPDTIEKNQKIYKQSSLNNPVIAQEIKEAELIVQYEFSHTLVFKEMNIHNIADGAIHDSLQTAQELFPEDSGLPALQGREGVADAKSQYSSYVNFHLGISIAFFVTPIINYFDDTITGNNPEKSIFSYYAQEGLRTLTSLATSTAVNLALPKDISIANKVIITKFITDSIISPSVDFFSKDYAYASLINLASSCGMFALAQYNKMYIINNPVKTALLIQTGPAALKLAYHIFLNIIDVDTTSNAEEFRGSVDHSVEHEVTAEMSLFVGQTNSTSE